MIRPLAGQVVLVTGAARGIGAALARQLARRGARLSLVGLEPERLGALARELGPGHCWFECDVTSQEALERAVEGTVAALGKLNVVVANAGVASSGTVAITPPDALARTLEVNLIGAVRTVSATLQQVLAQRGYYLLVSSAASLTPMPGLATYCASKAGLEMFAASFRMELHGSGVVVGVAHPSWVDTDLVRDQLQELPSFQVLLSNLPWPFNRITRTEACVRALLQAIEGRAPKVYLPRALLGLALLRGLLWTSWGEALIRRWAKPTQTQLDHETLGRGRFFGSSSVEGGRQP